MARAVPDNLIERLGGAAALFAEQGFDGTHITDIAEATGVPKATLYYYFAGKEEILSTLLVRILGVMEAAVADAVSSEGTARERVERVIEAQVAVIASQPDACRLLLEELGRITRIPELAVAIREAFHEPVQKLLVEGRKDGSFVELDAEAVASAVFGAVTMTALHYLLVDELDPEHVTEVVLALLLGGLRGT